MHRFAIRFYFLPLFIGLFGSTLAQSGQFLNPNNTIDQSFENSNIIGITNSDSVLIKVNLKNALYAAERNFLPYYVISKTTDYNESAIPTLKIKKTHLLTNEQAKIILNYYGSYIKNDFQLIAKGGLCKNENLNPYQLIPFRKNANNQVEELVDYDASWQINSNNQAALARGTSIYTTTSVLSKGDWYKIAVTQSGVHKITREFLKNIGIDLNTINPKNIHLYGNGGNMLPEKNKDFRYDDLQENSILVSGEDDGKFDAQDYILFYATGPDYWVKNNAKGLKFKAVKNLYSDTSFYYLHVNSSSGKRITAVSNLNQTPNFESSSYDFIEFHEENLVNFGKSGRDFYGEFFDYIKNYEFSWKDNDFVVNDSLICDVSLVAIHSDTSDFQVSGNGLSFIVTTGAMDFNQQYEDYAKPGNKIGYTKNTSSEEIKINISKLTNKSIGYLDKISINARRNLVIRNKQFTFRDSRTCGAGKITKFNLSNPFNAAISIWDVSDPLQPKQQLFAQEGSYIYFTATADSLKHYCVSSPSDYYSPSFIGKVDNQNLHSIEQTDYLIIAHPLFLKEAQQIGAFHKQKEGLNYQVASTEQIYNEFGSGKPDISAIRDFIRMVYTRTKLNGSPLKYVLLMGDGSYINRNRNIINNTNFIPTYQSISSLSETQSIATDDFYGLMDPDEGQNAENYGSIDLGIGRFTCKTTSEMKAVINKVFNYYQTNPNLQMSAPQNPYSNNESTLGDWRNNLLFLADDDDSADHMEQSNSLTSGVTAIDANYNIDKIYLDAYQRFSTAGGARYPDASQDFIRRIQKGALIFNYTGHGGEVGLTAERIIDVEIINNLNNYYKLPLFITATCEFSRYDDPARTSAGELCLLNAKGGAVALFTTCRLAYSGPNFILNAILLNNTFKKLAGGKRPTLGDIVQLTKSDPRISQSYVYANFHLLGDPAMYLAYPKEKVFTTHINQQALSSTSSDTLKALTKITVSGFVGDSTGKKLNFNGLIYPTVFDKEQSVTCLMNVEKSAINWPLPANSTATLMPFEFKLQKNILYRGKALVSNGDFSFTFMVPKDIGFSYGPGRISYYASNGSIDANGYYSKIVVGGASSNTSTDTEGPKVNLYMNDKSFVNGGITNENPVMFANLVDSSGINTVGTGLGHDVSVILDGKSSNPIILNDYYEADLNSYQSGRVRYPFSDLSEGQHNLAFKVWDIQNNSNTVYADFVVTQSADLALKQVLNYPNPFTTHTQFMFQHNQTCVPLKVTVQIYTVSGKAIKTIQQTVTCDDGVNDAIEWDGKDDYGQRIGRGVYIYKLAIINPENKKAEKIEKLVILN